MTILIIALKTLVGGVAVVAFSLIGEAGQPKRFAGLFAAAPSVALASLGNTAAPKGPPPTGPYAGGMLIGSAGMVAYCLVSLSLTERLNALSEPLPSRLAGFFLPV